jgi:ribosomal protein L40E
MARSGLSPDTLEPEVAGAGIDVLLAQAESLERLRRTADRERKLGWAMAVATDCFEAHRDSALAILNTARVAKAAGKVELAARMLQATHKLKSDQITEHNILYLEHLLVRERVVADGSLESLAQRLHVYVCQRCGRLIEYISRPCMSCGWCPTTLLEISQSARLSRVTFSLWDLLAIGREIMAGRKVTDVVPNLAQVAAEEMADPKSMFREEVESIAKITQGKQFDNYYYWHEAAVCESCGTYNPRQDAKTCRNCNTSLRLSPPLRLLMCLTRTLEHFQRNFDAPKSNESDLFIRYLVSLQSKLVRTQETPSPDERARLLELMTKLSGFELANGIGEIVMVDPKKISSRLHDGLSEERKPLAIAILADFKDTLQFLADWVSRTKGLS